MRFKTIFFLGISLWLTVSACNRKSGCPGVNEYTKQIAPKVSKESNRKGTGAWTKKNKRKDNRKATSGIFPKNMKKWKHTSSRKSQSSTKAQAKK